LWYAAGSFNWKGPPITQAWIDQATMSDGTVIECQPVSNAPLNFADGEEFPRYVAGDPLPMLSMQEVRAAQFTHEVWPRYPSETGGVRRAGYAVVQTVVDDTGTVREAFVVQSSGFRSLDLTAVAAAASSTYRPPSSGAVALYEAVYQFVP
jgi:protein TonB